MTIGVGKLISVLIFTSLVYLFIYCVMGFFGILIWTIPLVYVLFQHVIFIFICTLKAFEIDFEMDMLFNLIMTMKKK